MPPIAQAKSACPNRSRGCTWTFTPADMPLHVTECKFRSYGCIGSQLNVFRYVSGERTRHGRVAELQPVLLDRVLGGHSVERHQAGGRVQQALPVLHRVQRDPRDGVLCADLLWTARRGSPVLLRV
uniref:(northern house mosquito) hypothetical protein n=1 Tax=Culex pipiens TaxID=7175 RepID=A0A8D8BSQ0_CULPI